MMKAIRVREYGDPSVLRLEEVPVPEPGRREYLVAVEAAGVIATDILMRRGLFDGFLGLRVPYTPGWDYAGTVVAAGSGAGEFKAGDPVYGMLPGQGAYAQFLVAGPDNIARRPANLDASLAGAVPLAATTAYKALIETARIQKGQRVLILGASGGVGSLAVQIAASVGADVMAVASAGKADFVQNLGASRVISTDDGRGVWAEQNADVVLDAVGPEVDSFARAALAPGGHFIRIAGPPPSVEALRAEGLRATFVGTEPNSERLREVTLWIEEGHLRPQVDRIVPLESAELAHRALESRTLRGKIVLNVSHSGR